MPSPASPGSRLRDLMNTHCVAAPGAFSALCGRAIARAGFEACYISGAATSVSAGVPDVGLLSLEHFCRCIREVADHARDATGRPLPILADADTGFGEAEMVRRTVIEYARAGAAGLHLEDQQFPKRCGHLDGKTLVPTDHMAEKIEWAARARVDDFVLCARTDARSVEGFDGAVARAKAYLRAGADMIFPEGLTSEDEFARFAGALRTPGSNRRPYLLANMTEFGKTPIIPLSRFDALGYSIVIYPVSLLRVAMGAVTRALEALKRDGSVDALLPQMQSRKDLYELIGYTPGVPWEFPDR
jgi:methylisocitrate lyase